jgi:hypothetical protein
MKNILKKIAGLFIFNVVLLLVAFVLIRIMPGYGFWNSEKDFRGGPEYVILNYGADIDSAAKLFDLPAAYFKALCLLECEGKKTIVRRYEKHVFQKLKRVKEGSLASFENVTTEMIGDAGDEALENLASSWGPFQLMGYKCLLLNIKIRDIRGPDAVYWGVKWIDITYGDYLRKRRFRDAFHMHNAGTRFPADGKARTHDSKYIPRGLYWVDRFEKKYK